MRNSHLGRVLFITDLEVAERAGTEIVAALDAALSAVPIAGAVVQVRAKSLAAGDLLHLTRRVLQVARARRCPVLVNDRADVAIAAGADGVHLPETGLPISAVRRMAKTREFLVGVSTHSPDTAGAAARDGADLVLCGPIWETPAKRDLGQPLGLDKLRDACRVCADSAALYAVGGVDPSNAKDCIASGAHGIAAIRAWLAGGDAAASARALIEALDPR